jgi:hypothetical protein
MIYAPLSPSDEALLARVREEFFSNSPIRIDTVKHETQWLDASKKLWFGVWAGPAADVANLLHEMAHFVEIDERRMGMHGWGLKLPKMYSLPGRYGGTSWCEPKTMQISARELRVMAFQHHLHVYLGVEPWREQVASLLRWLPDWYNVPGHGDGPRSRWMVAQYDRLIKSPRYSLASFRAEWTRRNEILKARYARADRRARALTSPA